MKFINDFSLMYAEDFKLCISMLKDEYNSSLIGILKRNEKIIEYCETINISNCSMALRIYDIIKKNQVFPSHFYYVMDDILI